MDQAVLWVGDVDAQVRSAFAAHALRLDVSACALTAQQAMQRAEPAFVIFARWSQRCARVIAQWRQAGRDMPVLVGVQPDVAQCRAALDAGATDYLLRPFSADAAITRMRTHTTRRPAPVRLLLGERTIDFEQRAVTGPAGTQVLTELEARLLGFLGAALDTPVRTETILRQVWGYPTALPTRAVANTVMRLRRKLEADPRQPRHLLTVRGVGYRLVAAPARDAPPQAPRPHIGRAARSGAASEALTSRGVLLYGPPAVGEPRLALAERCLGSAVYVDLTAATTQADVIAALASALALPRPFGDVPRDLEDAGA